MSVQRTNCHEMKWKKHRKSFTGSDTIEVNVDMSESRFSEVMEPDARLKWDDKWMGWKEIQK